MTGTHIPIVHQAPQAFAEWINELSDDLGWEKQRAYLLLCETLHAIRDFLPVDEAADLGAQLPVLVRGIYYEGWVPSKTPVKPRSKRALFDRIESRFKTKPIDDTGRAVAAVFGLLQRHVTKGELDHVKHAMREPIQELWE